MGTIVRDRHAGAATEGTLRRAGGRGAPPCRGRRCPAQARYRADVRDRGAGWLDVGVPLCPYHLQWVSNHGRLVAFEEVRAVPGVGT